MNHFASIKRTIFTGLIITIMSISNTVLALDATTLNNDINKLITQGNTLLVTVKGTNLSSIAMSSQLNNIETDVNNFQIQVTRVYDTIVAAKGITLTLTDELLVSFQTLSTVSSSIAKANLGLTVQIANIASATATSSLDSSLKAMLRLSDDIGLMADRILEMANKILIMADNIGLMADRIVATQIIQSDNLKVVIDAILQTQTNTIEVIKLFI